MALMAFGVAGYAVALLAAPHTRSPFDVSLFAALPLPVVLHLAGGAIAISFGALQMSATLRRRHIKVHRWLGRLYVLAVCVAALASLRMAANSFGGIPTHLGFGLLAILWLTSTLLAFLHARARRIELHRMWMIRSYALTLAAVMLRVYIPLSQIAGLPFERCYIAISWLCWVPNLVIADWWILARRHAAVVADNKPQPMPSVDPTPQPRSA
jgi:uncharacterized membrane protein